VSKLSKNWIALPLGEVVQTQKGRKPVELGMRDGSHTVPYINISVFEGNPVKEYAPTQDIPQCRASDTLLVWDGARAGLCGRGVVGYIGSTLMRITSDCVNPAYLYYFLHSQYGTLNTRTKGVGIPHIDPVVFNNLEFSLAPTAEQTRIVAKLEELLSDLDAGVAELKAAQKKLVQYRQSLLKSAVEGALTAPWREARRQHNGPTETGAQLLQRILTERRARWEAKQLARFKEQSKTPPKDWQKKYAEPMRPDTSGLPKLPKDWVWSSIGHCFHVAVGATPSRKEPSYWNGNIPWISSGEVRFSRITRTREAITEEGLNNSSTQINPAGSVMLGMIGEGKTRGQVSILDIEAANNQNCAAIRVSDTDIPPEYVYFWLWSRYEETRRGSSGNNQPALNKSIVENIPCPLPPLDELKAIVSLVSTSMDQIQTQEQSLEISFKQSAAQRQNILKAAFAGQLVPQDPHDEPASVLLARIRAERAAQPALKKPRGRQSKEAA
jgi:type I restriction enzyme, S subunit